MGDVIVTPIMESLLRKLQNEDTKRYILLRPKGTGKTTTLYWLYCQLKHLGKKTNSCNANCFQRPTKSICNPYWRTVKYPTHSF